MDAELREALTQATGVLFVCSGNIMRSAFAELYARHLGLRLPVRSTGLIDLCSQIHPEAAAELEVRGVPPQAIIAFRSSCLHHIARELDAGTVVFGMAPEHVRALKHHPVLAARTFLLTRLVGREEAIADPVGTERMPETAAEIARCVEALVAGTAS